MSAHPEKVFPGLALSAISFQPSAKILKKQDIKLITDGCWLTAPS